MDKNTIKNRIDRCPLCGDMVREWFNQQVLTEVVCVNPNCPFERKISSLPAPESSPL